MSTSNHQANHPQALEAYCAELCRVWGADYALAPPAVGAGAADITLRTPDQGLIEVRRRGDELEFRAARWPSVQEEGFKRSYRQDLSAKVSANRDAESVARDLQRRLLTPYASALAQARHNAAEYRRLITDIGSSLDQIGLSRADRHVLGRKLQAQKPHGALDNNGSRLPTTSVTTVTARDESAVGGVEVRGLSLGEIEALHGFIDELVARRRPVLRLAS